MVYALDGRFVSAECLDKRFAVLGREFLGLHELDETIREPGKVWPHPGTKSPADAVELCKSQPHRSNVVAGEALFDKVGNGSKNAGYAALAIRLHLFGDPIELSKHLCSIPSDYARLIKVQFYRQRTSKPFRAAVTGSSRNSHADQAVQQNGSASVSILPSLSTASRR